MLAGAAAPAARATRAAPDPVLAEVAASRRRPQRGRDAARRSADVDERRATLDLAATVALARATRSSPPSGSPGCSPTGSSSPTSLVVVVVGHGASLAAAPAPRPGRRRRRWSPASCSRGRSPGCLPRHVRRRVPDRARRGTSRAADLGARARPVPGRRRARRATSAAGRCWRRSARLRRATPTRSRSAPAARGEALVPGAVLFVFVAALGADRHRIGLDARARRRRVPRRRPAARPVRPAAAHVARPAAPPARRRRCRRPPSPAPPSSLGAWVIGPRLPGRRRRAARRHAQRRRRRHRGPQPARRHPLAARQPARHRAVRRDGRRAARTGAAAALPEFDGNTWGLPDRSLEDVDGDAGATPRPARRRTTSRSRSPRSAASSCPAAAEPVGASTGDGLRWNAETSTLVRDRPRPRGRRPLRRSCRRCRRFTPDVLRAATSADAARPDLPRAARRLPDVGRRDAPPRSPPARRPTYDQMLALQDWFRTKFQYSLDVPPGHSTSAIEAFLRQRIGYCEQFAGTFAAMARALGIPARVAVGYTPGLLQADGTRSCSARTPTPGRRSGSTASAGCRSSRRPGAARPAPRSYTGVAPAQDEAAPGPATDEATGAGGDAPPVRRRRPQPTRPIRRSTRRPDPGARTDRPRRLDRGARTAPSTGSPSASSSSSLAVAAGRCPAIVRRWRRAPPERRRGAPDRRAVAPGARRASRRPGCRIDPTLTPIEQARADRPAPAGRGPPAEVAGRGRDRGDVRTARRGRRAGRRRRPRRAAAASAGAGQVERIADDSMTTGGRLRRYFTVWHVEPVERLPARSATVSVGSDCGRRRGCGAAGAAEPGADRQRAERSRATGGPPARGHGDGQHDEERRRTPARS